MLKPLTHSLLPTLKAFSRTRLVLVLRAVVSLALLAIVISRLGLAQTVALLAAVRWPWVGLTVVIYIAAELLSGWRWQILLRAQGYTVPLRSLLASLLVARFFNQFMVSTIGGDTARFWYSSRLTGRPLQAGIVLLADRLIGLVALFLLAAGAAIVGTQFLPELQGWRWLALLGGVGGLLGLYLVTHPAVTRWTSGRGPAVLQKVVQVLEAFRNRPAALRQSLLLSLLLQFIVIFRYYTLARAVGIELSPMVFALIVPVALLILAVPLTINGLGLREVTFIGLLSLWGISAQQSTAFAWLDLGFGLTIATAGGLFFLLRRT